MQALEELVPALGVGGLALGGTHWKPIVARRRELLAKLADWTPPPALGTMPEAATNDPITVMLWGITPGARCRSGRGRRTARRSSCAARRRRRAWSRARRAS